jgi:N-glycosylase/DNA lyase
MSIERNENYNNAIKEFTRADHLLFVSLKYSRTVDVIQSVINRLVEACKYSMIAGIEAHYTDEEEIKKYLHGNATIAKATRAAYPDLEEYILFFNFLRKLNKAEVKQRLNEFRRHVTLVTELEEKEVRVKIEDVNDYYEKVRELLKIINKHVHNVDEDLFSHKN